MRTGSKLFLTLLVILFSFLNTINLSAAQKAREPLPSEIYSPTPEESGTPGSLTEIQPGAEIPQSLKKKWDRWSRLQVRVFDGRTKKPLEGAHVVIAETGQRVISDQNGVTPIVAAPVIRDPRYEHEILQRLHGQLTLVAYKNGYRDSVYFNVRMREGLLAYPEIWMYEITPEDRRIEPVVYYKPTNHLFILELTNLFRDERQLGEGWQNPER